MRDIKFRAWLEQDEKMVHVTQLDLVYKTLCVEWDAFIEVDAKEHYKLMQYTGLQDKNGKLIYEGDVVKGHWWERGNRHRHVGRVAYVMSTFKVRGVKQYLGMDDELNQTYEVIGNIYEHPHLLEGDNQ